LKRNSFSHFMINRPGAEMRNMRTEVIRSLVGRPVKDTYGRYVGFVVGFSVDTSGELESVGVDQGSGEFTEYPSQRVVSTEDGFVVIPVWKVDSEQLAKEIEGVRRRAKALQELMREGEIPKGLYDEMFTGYNSDAEKITDAYKDLAQNMVERVQQLEQQKESLERFLANLKVQFRSGEIDEGAYKVAADCCQAMRERNEREGGELERTLKAVTEPLSSGPGTSSSNSGTPRFQTVEATTE
jgi:CdvA-like coiled-coil domain